MRMESGEVALIPVEDLDMDNMFVDAPDAIANAIYAAPPVFDMFAAESQLVGWNLQARRMMTASAAAVLPSLRHSFSLYAIRWRR